MQLFLLGYPHGHLDDEIMVVAGTVANFGKVNMESFWKFSAIGIFSA